MKYEWVDSFCLAMRGASKDYQTEWRATRYKIRDKMFVMVGGDREGKPILTVKLEPDYGSFLRQTFRDIVPGYYMNKEHWNSLSLEGSVPDNIVKEMLTRSYRLVLGTFSRKKQKEILGLEGLKQGS